MLKEKIGFIGAGGMGEALIKSIIDKKLLPLQNIWVCDKVKKKLYLLAKSGVRITTSIKETVKEVDIIVLAVKPGDIKLVLRELKEEVNPSQLIISIAAGVSIYCLTKLLNKNIPIVRVMPNTPICVGEGMCVFTPGPGVKKDKIKVTRQILKAVGKVEELPEDKQNAVTGLSGSGPAYIYTVIEGLIKGGIKVGLSRKIAYNLAIQTTLGAAKLAKKSNLSLEDLLSAVVSPKGTTAEGLKVLKERELKDCIAQAVIKSTERANQISTEMESNLEDHSLPNTRKKI